MSGSARALVVAIAVLAADGCRRGTPIPPPRPPTAPKQRRLRRAAAPAATPTTPAPTGAAKRRYRRIDVHTHIGPDGIARAVRLMNEWGIDGVVNLSGMHPGPPREMLETQLAAAATARRTHRRVHDAQLQARAHAQQGLRRGDGRPSSRRGSASARAASRSRRASASVTSAPEGRSCWPSTIRWLEPAVREGGRARDAGRDPHR